MIFHDPGFSQAADNLIRGIGNEPERGFENDEFREIALAIAKREFIVRAVDDFTVDRQHFDGTDVLADIAVAATGIATQCTANCSGNSREIFKPGKTGFDSLRNSIGKECSTTSHQRCAFDFNVLEGFMCELDDSATDTFIPHEEIRATAENTDCDLLGSTGFDHSDEFFDATRFEKVLHRATQFHPGVRSQWLVAFENVVEFFEKAHSESGRYGQRPQ